jgi:AcrR family transcriptional regulator
MKDLSDRQVEIIKHTIELMGEEGAHNFSIRKLAKRVGVTEPAVYRHFESKDDLMVNVASFIVQNWNLLLTDIKVPKLPPVDQLRLIFENVIVYCDENRLFARTVFTADLISSDTGMTRILKELKHEGVQRFSQMLREWKDRGEINRDINCGNVTDIFFGAFQWVMSDWISEDFSYDLKSKWAGVWRELEGILR